MSHWTHRFFLLFFLLMLCHCGEPQDQATLAEVNQEKITVAEFKSTLAREKENLNPNLAKQKEEFKNFKQKNLDLLIQNHILEKEALAKNISVSEEELQKEEKKYKSNYSDKDFSKMLEAHGILYEDWKNLKRQNLLLNKFVESFLLPQIQISEDQIKTYYEAHLAEFTEGPAVKARHILTDNEKSAQDVLQRIRKGENFAKLAKESSQAPERDNGGELPWMTRGSFPKEFEVCFDLKEGQVSEVISSLYGFHLFKVIAKRAEQQHPLSEVEKEVKTWLTKEALEARLQSYYQEVKPNYSIKVNSWTLSRIKNF